MGTRSWPRYSVIYVIRAGRIQDVLGLAFAITALLIPTAARAQVDTSSDGNYIVSGLRALVDPVAAVAGFGSLRDDELPPGVRREVRAALKRLDSSALRASSIKGRRVTVRRDRANQ